MKSKSENAKDQRWNIPVDLPGVKPEEYREEIEANQPEHKPARVGPPNYTLPGYPSGKDTASPKKLA